MSNELNRLNTSHVCQVTCRDIVIYLQELVQPKNPPPSNTSKENRQEGLQVNKEDYPNIP
jgi:hypothetical protein